MKSYLDQYVESISTKFSYEETSEMGYRTDFELLLKEIFATIDITRFDHDAKAKKGNKPDFVVVKNDVPILYIETKDIGISLDKIEKSEQMSRYFGYANLVLTDYIEFRLYRNGVAYGKAIKIAEFNKNNRIIKPLPHNYEYLIRSLIDFTQSHREPIRSGEHLAKIMGGKGQRIRDNIKAILSQETNTDTEFTSVYKTIKKLLIHDLTTDSFADMYAQTLVYGLFVARFYDTSLSTFSRQEARDLIPASNPFLGNFFEHIAGRNFERRLSYIVDELCEVFAHANVAELMEQHFKTARKKGAQRGQDQVIHFYEDFLKEYDKDLRKKMGAYYTPLPVVRFIVQSVDALLEKEFRLTGGLSNTSKSRNGLHRVQILDPAVGTGTFISDIIGQIYRKLRKNNQLGQWPSYVHHELLPRIYGFELMMAPYTIAHLKLSMALKETGFLYFNETRTGKARLGIYLTNSLEEANKQPELLAFDFGASIADEAREASKIKNEKPVMVVIANPPYSGISSNETPYANSLVKRYKTEPGGVSKLKERKHWLNNDYVKFIAMAESLIEKTGEGILAMITDNGYLDNPTFRGMRWHLTKTFDKIYIYNLHGSVKKHDRAPDGSKDENVFDIMQGVSIILAIKLGKKKTNKPAELYYADLFGTRKHKFEELSKTPKWVKLALDSKMYYFFPESTKGQKEYEKGFKLNELFRVNVTGIVTMGDNFIVSNNRADIVSRVNKLALGEYTNTYLNNTFNLGKNYANFILGNSSKIQFDETKIIKLNYRPFDTRWTYFDNKVVWRWRENVMKHYLIGSNVGLLVTKAVRDPNYQHIFVTNNVSEAIFLSGTTASNAINMPLYLYDEFGERVSNLNPNILAEIESVVGETIPETVFDYIYATLHSTLFRRKYNHFLKRDFPIIPYPQNKNQFNNLSMLGKKLRLLHILESSELDSFITEYSIEGTDIIENIVYKENKIFINNSQYFGGIFEAVWNFWIGGYQPAQKWLKDRKDRVLTNQDINHYQRIITAISKTIEVMKTIDK